jgi:hypothetical protein
MGGAATAASADSRRSPPRSSGTSPTTRCCSPAHAHASRSRRPLKAAEPSPHHTSRDTSPTARTSVHPRPSKRTEHSLRLAPATRHTPAVRAATAASRSRRAHGPKPATVHQALPSGRLPRQATQQRSGPAPAERCARCENPISTTGLRPEARYCGKHCRQAASRARLVLQRQNGAPEPRSRTLAEPPPSRDTSRDTSRSKPSPRQPPTQSAQRGTLPPSQACKRLRAPLVAPRAGAYHGLGVIPDSGWSTFQPAQVVHFSTGASGPLFNRP